MLRVFTVQVEIPEISTGDYDNVTITVSRHREPIAEFSEPLLPVLETLKQTLLRAIQEEM